MEFEQTDNGLWHETAIGEEALVAEYGEGADLPIVPTESMYDQEVSEYPEDIICREDTVEEPVDYPSLTLAETVEQADAARTVLTDQANVLWAVIEENEPVARRVEADARVRYRALDHSANQSEIAQAYMDAIQADPETQDMPGIDGQIVQIRELLPLVNAAEVAAHEAAIAEYDTVRERAVSAIDWVQVVDAYADGEGSDNEVPRLVCYMQPQCVMPFTYRKVLQIVEKLRQTMDAVAAPDEANPPHLEVDSLHEDIADTGEWLSGLNEAYTMMPPVRVRAMVDALGGPQSGPRIAYLCTVANSSKAVDGLPGLPPTVGSAILKKARSLQDNCRTQDVVWRAEYLENAPPSPEIRGKEVLQNAYKDIGLDADEVTSVILDNHTAPAPRAVVYHESDFSQQELRSGWYNYNEDSINIVVGAVGEERPLWDIYDTGKHEEAHHSHSNVESLDRLIEWVGITKSDPSGRPPKMERAIAYMEALASSGKPSFDWKTPAGEDYAYSVVEYCWRPDAQRARSAARFEFMNRLHGKYDANDT